MKKENYIKDLKEIHSLVGKVKSINESIQFEDDEFDNYAPAEEMGAEEPEQCANGECDLGKMKPEEPTEEDGLRETGEVDAIREIALKGMIKLCKNPNDERYQALKKIFQFCDKAAENKEGEQQNA